MNILLQLLIFAALAVAVTARSTARRSCRCSEDARGSELKFSRNLDGRVRGALEFGPCGRPRSFVSLDMEDQGEANVCGGLFNALETIGRFTEILKHSHHFNEHDPHHLQHLHNVPHHHAYGDNKDCYD